MAQPAPPQPRRGLLSLALGLLCLWAMPAWAFDACAPDAAAHYTPVLQQRDVGLLWRVERCGAPASYVFGTMHSDEALAWKQGMRAARLLNRVKRAGFEYIQPADAAQLTNRAMFDPLGSKPLQKQVSLGEWYKLQRIMVQQRGMPLENLQRLRPWAAAVMLQMPPSAQGDGVVLDDKLKQLAAEKKLERFGLETLKEQLQIFETMPDAQQITMLKTTLKNVHDIEITNKALLRAYGRGDAVEIQRLGEKGFDDITDPALRDYLKNALLTRRNHVLAERAATQLEKGETLIAIGALHLPSAEGVLNLLEKQGYYIFPEK